MNKLNDVLSLIDGYVGGSQWFVFLLLGTGLFFTIYLKFPQFRYLKHSIRIVRGKFGGSCNPERFRDHSAVKSKNITDE